MFASGKTAAVATAANYIEDVFSTYLYTGNGSTQTITNGIDLAGKGGLVWIKGRTGISNNMLWDSVSTASLSSNTTDASGNSGTFITGTSNDGFSINNNSRVNQSTYNYASWTFRKQPKFFDVVTFTGNGNSSSYNIAHNLGAQPGFIIVKGVSTGSQWTVLARTNSTQYVFLYLNSTMATPISAVTQSTYATSTTIDVGAMKGNLSGDVNLAGETYVAYLYAHNAGGFGLTGTDNVISCGSYTGTGVADNNVTLGYEPQWVMIKRTDSTGDWNMQDVMRGMSNTDTFYLKANSSSAEIDFGYQIVYPNATGFTLGAGTAGWNASGGTYIYIAIRRGPMKVPTSGTSVFSPNYASSTTGQQITTGFPVDSQILRYLPSGIGGYWFDRLRGVSTTTTESGQALYPNATTAETTENYTRYFNNTGYQQNSGFAVGTQMIGYSFGRAPSFFDEVCYTGTDAVRTINHNLGVAPELIIVKGRNTNPANSSYWTVYTQPTGNTNYMYLDSTNATSAFSGYWNNTSPTASVFTLGTGNGEDTNATGKNYVAYLFATCAGVSKVGSYTGNGSTQTINCGFTGGARFVLIKRTDDAGNWYVYDTARGMTTLTDPYLRLNTTTAESATLGSVTTVSTGFAVNASILAAINTNAASYIFLAIA